MKYSGAVILAVTGLAIATPHAHRHQHAHRVKKDIATVNEIVYELNGQIIPANEVMQGIANGTLVWGQGGEVAPAPSAIPEVQHAQVEAPPTEPSEPAPAPQTQEAPKPTAEAPKADPKPQQSTFDGDFPDYDNSLSCGEFPEKFGALPLDYLGLNGFAGIQHPQSSLAQGFADILTLKAGMFQTDGDYEGAFFSYACPAGYQNVQWPSTQGATKQSVGGLLCKDGKLTLTRGDVTKKLCDAGTDKVTIKIKNTLGKGVATCRTNYPGPEDETIPIFVDGGSESKVACPDSTNYYVWNGMVTSAQLYVNQAGVSQEDGCQWGEPGSGMGNDAPMNMGLGWNGEMAYISLLPNHPTNYHSTLDFTITIEGDDINGNCKWDASKKQYCTGANYENCDANSGCTTAVRSGTATFVFS